MSSPRILIAYDGSPAARKELLTVASLFPGATAVLLYTRQPLEGFAAHLHLARSLGLNVQPLIFSPIATATEAIVDTAEQLNVDFIALGSRGFRGFKAMLSGSTSASVLQRATRPTLVIPSDSAALTRRRSRRQ